MSNDFYIALAVSVIVFLSFPVTMLRQVEHPQQSVSHEERDGVIYVSIPLELEKFYAPNILYISNATRFRLSGAWMDFTTWYTDNKGWNTETWPWWAKALNGMLMP